MVLRRARRSGPPPWANRSAPMGAIVFERWRSCSTLIPPPSMTGVKPDAWIGFNRLLGDRAGFVLTLGILSACVGLFTGDIRPFAQHYRPICPTMCVKEVHCELYLAGILDVYSRRLIGYAMDAHRDERLVERALEMALGRRRPRVGLVHHSDRGSQYTSHGYRGLLACHGIVRSLSGKAEPYDTALMESFFGTLKAECVERHDFQTQ